MSDDYQIYIIEGMKTAEAVTENEDGSYTIFVNDALCHEKQMLAVEHAIEHINNDDFEKEDVQKIETAVHEEVSCYGQR